MKQLNWYQIFGKSNIPDGRTVLPTDDIQIWLNCADIWDKTYTTLSEVLNDTATLSALMASDNAVDYLVRSTSWAVSVALVPTMTDNTHPSGICTASAIMSDAYKCFDGNNSTYWYNNGEGSAGNNYVEYDFPSLIEYEKVAISAKSSSNEAGSWDIVLKGYINDGWEELGSMATPSIVYSGGVYSYSFAVTCGSANKLRIYSERSNDSGKRGSLMIHSLQFYSPSITTSADAMTAIGNNNYCANTLLADATWCNAICNSEYFESVLNASIPKMTSNTTPKGIASATSIYSSDYDAYTAFKGNEISSASDYGWATASGVRNADLKYQTDADSSFKPIFMKVSRNASYNTNFVFYGSNDGNTYTDLLTVSAMTTSAVNAYVIQNDVDYGYFKWSFSSSANLSGGSGIKIRLYGRKDI